MAYRKDSDLEFLQHLEDKDLNDLARCLVYDRDGKKRYAEHLSDKSTYKSNYPKHTQYWEDIAEEIQRYGANGIVTLFRGGKGVSYKEVLEDVCDHLKVNYKSTQSTVSIEDTLLLQLLDTSISKMSAEEIDELAKELGVEQISDLSTSTLIRYFNQVFLKGGAGSYQLTLLVASLVLGQGLTIAGKTILSRSVAASLAGPIGIALASVWTLIDIAGPAYRVTVPAVIHIALLRKKQMLKKEELRQSLQEALGV